MTDKEEESLKGSRNDKTMVFHHAKIEVERFIEANYFGMWRCEVKDILCQQDLEEVLGDKPDDIEEKVWIKMNHAWKEIWRKLEEKYFDGGALELFALGNLGVDVSNETKAVCLLNSLPDDYEHLATTLTYEKEKMVYEETSTALLNHACMRKEKKESKSSTLEALIEGEERPWWSREERVQKLYTKPKQKDKGQSFAANIVHKDDNDSDYSLSISSMACSSSSIAEWILDCTTTFHYCPREWFSSFEKTENASVVFMENNNPCQIMGVGSNRLKMFDGIVRELKNAGYIPSMKKNLISLGYLEAKGYRYGAQDGILKVSASAMVLMKETRRNNLYFLQESKLDPRAKKPIFMSLQSGVKGYKVWDLEARKIILSRDVTFDEASMLTHVSYQQEESKDKGDSEWVEIESTPHILDSFVSTQADQGIVDQDQGITDHQGSTDSDGMTDEETVDDTKHVDSIDEGPIATRLPKRNVGAPKRITDDMATTEGGTVKMVLRDMCKSRWYCIECSQLLVLLVCFALDLLNLRRSGELLDFGFLNGPLGPKIVIALYNK
ncbi:hypothetical protein V2J09_001508 [Rumex salicifolius]